jgi:hypothetical protein
MALKDLSSLYDLVGGNQPVGNMENQQGGTPFDLGEDSTLQQDSLPEVPTTSPYQDLDAIDGGNGYFHGIANPGKTQGKQIGGVDLHEHLLTQRYSYIYGESPENVGPSPGPTGNSEYQDLDAIDEGNGYFHGIANPGKSQGKKIGKKDLHIHLLNNQYQYTHGDNIGFSGPAPGGYENSEYQDLDGVNGGNGFFHGVDQKSTLQGKKILGDDDLHISLLNNQNYGYSYGTINDGNQPGQAGPYLTPSIDLNGGFPSTGKYEDNGPEGGFF